MALHLNHVEGMVAEDEEVEVVPAPTFVDEIDECPEAKGIRVRQLPHGEFEGVALMRMVRLPLRDDPAGRKRHDG